MNFSNNKKKAKINNKSLILDPRSSILDPWSSILVFQETLQLPLSFNSLLTTGAVEEIVWSDWNSNHTYSGVGSTVVGKSTQFCMYWAYFATMAQYDGHGEIHNCPSLQRCHALGQHFHWPILLVRHCEKNLEVPNHLMDLEEYWSNQHQQLDGANL